MLSNILGLQGGLWKQMGQVQSPCVIFSRRRPLSNPGLPPLEELNELCVCD